MNTVFYILAAVVFGVGVSACVDAGPPYFSWSGAAYVLGSAFLIGWVSSEKGPKQEGKI